MCVFLLGRQQEERFKDMKKLLNDTQQSISDFSSEASNMVLEMSESNNLKETAQNIESSRKEMQKGNGDKAFQEFLGAIKKLDNPELVPVVSSLNRIKEFSVASEAIMKLDYLVDYYQSGLSLQGEAILRGYGYLKTFPIDSALIIYDRLYAES